MLRLKYLLSLVLIFISLVCFSCAPTVVTTEASDSTVSADTDPESYATIFTHNKDCYKTDTMVGLEGNTVIGLFALQGPHATKSYYTLGYKKVSGSDLSSFNVQSLSGVATSSGSTTNRLQAKLTLNSAPDGDHHYQVVARNYEECYEKKASESKCKISGKVEKTYSYDVVTDIHFQVAKDTSGRDLLLGNILPAAVKGLTSSLMSDGIGKTLIVGATDALSGVITSETAPTDTVVVENGCINGWPTSN